MLINTEITKYLESELFDKEFVFKIDKNKYLPLKREDFLASKLKGKKIIHIGCADHLEVIDEKMKSGLWLHNILINHADDCLGIDINKSAVKYITEKYKIDNLIAGDVTKGDINQIKNNQWDIVLFGEIIEHINNPVEFLSAFKKNYSEYTNGFIVSVPNILNLARFKFMLKYSEVINSDHRYWFTPYTILKILIEAGYHPEQLDFVNLSRLSVTELIKRKMKKYLGGTIRYPYMYFNTIVVSGRL